MHKYLYILTGVLIMVALAYFFISLDNMSDLIRVSNPQPNQIIASPLTITGEARGQWYFEASFPVTLLDANGNVLAEHYATAQDEWMTENFVPFESVLVFPKPTTEKGTLVLQKDNPSGLPEHDAEIRIPVRFALTLNLPACRPTGCSGQVCSDTDVVTTCEYKEEYSCYASATCERQPSGVCGWTRTQSLDACLMQKGDMTQVKVFFSDEKSVVGGHMDCSVVVARTRVIPKTEGIARATLTELLKGPSQAEVESGLFHSIPQGVVIQSLTIENGVAHVDFNDALQKNVGGSCRVAAIRAQITETLKQFSTISNVMISINGQAKDILQP